MFFISLRICKIGLYKSRVKTPHKKAVQIKVKTYFISILVLTLLLFFFNLISHSPYRFNKFWVSSGLFQLFTYSSDMHHNRIIAVKIFLTPYALKNSLGSNHSACISAKQPHNFKCKRCEQNGLLCAAPFQ